MIEEMNLVGVMVSRTWMVLLYLLIKERPEQKRAR